MAADREITTGLPTRVTLLEHGVQELKIGLEGARTENREGIAGILRRIDSLSQDVSSRARPTNWVATVSTAVGVVGIVASIFALAEWRVTNAQAPLQASISSGQRIIERLTTEVTDVKTQLGIEKALREYRDKTAVPVVAKSAT